MMPIELAEGIRSDPASLGGKPVIAGTRIPVEQVVDLYRSGATMQDFLEGYRLSPEQVEAALMFAQQVEQDAASHEQHA